MSYPDDYHFSYITKNVEKRKEKKRKKHWCAAAFFFYWRKFTKKKNSRLKNEVISEVLNTKSDGKF